MTKLLRVIFLCVSAVVLQTTLASRMTILSGGPDFMLILLAIFAPVTDRASGFSVGAVMALLYHASVGRLPVVNLLSYSLLGFMAPMVCKGLLDRFSFFKKHRLLTLELILSALVLTRETVYLGYLFLTGSDLFNFATIQRPLMSVLINAVLLVPADSFVLRLYTPKKDRKKQNG